MWFDQLWFVFFRGIVRGIGLAPVFAVAIVLLIIGAVLLIKKHWRIIANAVLIVGASIAWIGLLAISEIKNEQKISSIITSRFHAFTDSSRVVAQLGLLAIPAAGVGVGLLQRKLARERRRQLLSTYLRIANHAFYSGDFDRAISDYTAAIKADPKRIDSYLKRGLAYREKGKYDQAIADFNRALTLDPDSAGAYLNRGKVRAASGDHAKAIEDFDRAIDLDAGNAGALLHRGIALAKIGENSRAADDFRRVLRVTNHSDFAEPAKFHLGLLEENLPDTGNAITTW